MIAGLIVGGSLAFGVAFTFAYLLRQDLRAWIEQPKHRFQASVQRYDREQVSGMHNDRSARS